MDVKRETRTHLELEKNGKKFTLICEQHALLGEVYDVLDTYKVYVVDLMISESKKNAEPAQEAVSEIIEATDI